MLTDATGRQLYPAGSSARIVSLVPSLTELLFDMGLQNLLVGRTSTCTEPADLVESINVIGTVRSVDVLALAELGPSHVLVSQTDTPATVTEEIVNLGVEVIQTHCNGPEDVGALFELIGGVFGKSEQAAALKRELDQVIAQAKSLAAQRPVKTVIYLTWKDPWITVSENTYASRLLEMTGLKTLCHDPEKRFPHVEMSSGLLSQADLVLLANEPFGFEDEDVQDMQLEYGIGSKPLIEIVDGRVLDWPGRRAFEALRGLTQLAARLP